MVALGSVLAIKLRDENPGMSPSSSFLLFYYLNPETCLRSRIGYTSTAALGLQSALSRVEGGFGIHSRVLGNVFYVMASQTTTVDVVRGIEERVILSL